MCRLFGMLAPEPIAARFWLLSASDSVLRQSHRNPDGTGPAYYVDRRPIVEKHPIAAHRDREFAAKVAGSTLISSSPTSVTLPRESPGWRTPSPSLTIPSP